MHNKVMNNGCNLIDISERNAHIDSGGKLDLNNLIPKIELYDGELEEYIEYSKKQKNTQGMDALPLDLFESMLHNCLFRKDYRSTFWLVVMANTGLRYSDVIKFRRADFTDENGNLRDSIVVQEKKTEKQRIIFINEAVKKALIMLLWHTDIQLMDYLITSSANRKGYELETYKDSNGKIHAVRKNGKYVYKLDKYGNKIPKPLTRSQSEKIMKKIFIENLHVALKNDWRCKDDSDAALKLNTHSIRKLYGKAITDDFINNFDGDEVYAHTAALRFLSQDYNHSSEAMTLRYSKDFEVLKKQSVMRINLGLNVINEFFEEELITYLAKQ